MDFFPLFLSLINPIAFNLHPTTPLPHTHTHLSLVSWPSRSHDSTLDTVRSRRRTMHSVWPNKWTCQLAAATPLLACPSSSHRHHQATRPLSQFAVTGGNVMSAPPSTFPSFSWVYLTSPWLKLSTDGVIIRIAFLVNLALKTGPAYILPLLLSLLKFAG